MGFFSSCEHEWDESFRKQGIWSPTTIPTHKCGLCGKEEDCVVESVEKTSWAEVNNYTYTVQRCRTCGFDPSYDNE